MDPLTILGQIGLGTASNAVYDFLKSRFMSTAQLSTVEFSTELQNIIDVNGVTMTAESVIEALATQGIIKIENTTMSAPSCIVIGAAGGKTLWGNNSIASTDNTSIVAGSGSRIETTGNAKIIQHPDGSIRFYT